MTSYLGAYSITKGLYALLDITYPSLSTPPRPSPLSTKEDSLIPQATLKIAITQFAVFAAVFAGSLFMQKRLSNTLILKKKEEMVSKGDGVRLNRLSPTLKSNFKTKTPKEFTESPQLSINSQLSDEEDKANYQSFVHISKDHQSEIIRGKIN